MLSNDPFFQQLVELAQSERTRVKWVFVPYPTLKWTLGERLLQARQNWANFRFATPFEVALESAAPSLLARGINPKPEALGPSLLHKLLLELPPSIRSFFRPLLSQPGTAEALWSTLREVRMAGLTSREVAAAAPDKPELPALLDAYESYLSSHRLADRATVFAESAPHALPDPDALLLEFPSAVWSPLERAFLGRLPGQRVPARVVGIKAPRRLSRSAVGEDAAPLVRARLSLFHAGRRDAELVEIFRRIRGMPLDEVEVALPDLQDLPLVRDKLAVYGIPATFESGLPIGYSRPGQAVLGVLSWVENRYSAFHLRQLLQADLLAIGASRLESPAAALYLERARATWERTTYAQSLGSLKAWLLERLAGRADDPRLRESLTYQVDMIDLLSDWICQLFEWLPGEGGWDPWVRGLARILEHHVPASSPADESARRRLIRSLDELLLLGSQRWSVPETVRVLRDKLQQLEFGASRALPGHLHVTTLDRLGLSGRRELFVLGLEEGRLDFNHGEDPVLSDRERLALHPDLARSEDRAEEARFHLRERLACADGHLTLSYSTRDMRTGQEQLPSWLFFQAARQLQPFPSFQDLFDWLGEPATYSPRSADQAAGETEWWLARGSRESSALTHFPFLEAGAEAVSERLSDRFTRYDGFAPSAAGKLDPRRTKEPTSFSLMSSTSPEIPTEVPCCWT